MISRCPRSRHLCSFVSICGKNSDAFLTLAPLTRAILIALILLPYFASQNIAFASDIESKNEVKKHDSKTGVQQSVFESIKLTCERDDVSVQVALDMKYSNVIPYSFIPRRVAESLKATKLGEIDFNSVKNVEKAPAGLVWNFIPVLGQCNRRCQESTETILTRRSLLQYIG